VGVDACTDSRDPLNGLATYPTGVATPAGLPHMAAETPPHDTLVPCNLYGLPSNMGSDPDDARLSRLPCMIMVETGAEWKAVQKCGKLPQCDPVGRILMTVEITPLVIVPKRQTGIVP
jgi:hypothetical protein